MPWPGSVPDPNVAGHDASVVQCVEHAHTKYALCQSYGKEKTIIEERGIK